MRIIFGKWFTSLSFTATLLSVVILNSHTTFADVSGAVGTFRLSVPAACTMGGTGTAHAASMDPGTYSGATGSEYENGIGKTTLTVVCNDGSGFSIYAVGYSDNKLEGENRNKLIGARTGSVIDTKPYVAGDAISNWSMKLTKIEDPTESYNPQNLTIQSDTEGTFSSWHSVPSTYAKVAEYHANTGLSNTDATLGVKLETTYAAFISSSQPADTYAGQVKYTMVHPYNEAPPEPQSSTAGCINYFANAANAEGTMGCQSANDGESIDLLASNFSREGYGFAGWSNKYDYATNTDSDLEFYGPQETITVPEGTTAHGLSLYAIWIKSQGSLQDSTKVASLCGTGPDSLTQAPTDGTANLSSVSALTDQRDNQTYAIAKLADGKCWMIENLRLEAEDSRGNNRFNPSITNESLAQGYNKSTTYGDFIGLANSEIDHFSNSTEANSVYYSGTQSGTASIDIGTTNYPNYRMPRYNNSNTSIRASNPSTNESAMYSYGNYYTWHAATANLSFNDTNNRSFISTSLCPSGWRLPQGGNKTRIESNHDNDYWGLIVDAINNEVGPFNYVENVYPYFTGSTEAYPVAIELRSYPNNVLYSGYFDKASVKGRGNHVRYWSSTALGTSNSYNLRLSDANVYPGTDYNSKIYGYSVRCIVRP